MLHSRRPSRTAIARRPHSDALRNDPCVCSGTGEERDKEPQEEPPPTVFRATEDDFERVFEQCVVPRALVKRQGAFAAETEKCQNACEAACSQDPRHDA